MFNKQDFQAKTKIFSCENEECVSIYMYINKPFGIFQAEYIYCYTYMTLVVNLMEDEHAPKIMVTSPSVISGEIQEGYETLTGFENILDPLHEENIYNKSGQGTSLKNHHNHTSASTSYNQCDSRSLSYEDLHSVGNNSHYMSENGYRTTESRHKGASRGKHKHSAGHVKENGYLVDMETYKQGPSHHHRMVQVRLC